MGKERILDIGIGAGGNYIGHNTAPNEQRIGVDLRDRVGRDTYRLRNAYPEVIPVTASAEHLPFARNTFSRLEIVLPFGELMVPGLQNNHFALNEKYKQEYAQKYRWGWYPELYRVLKPQGVLMIVGDIWIDPEQVELTSTPFFSVDTVRKLALDEFKFFGTSTTSTVISNISKNPYVEKIGKNSIDLLTLTTLKSNKQY